MSKHTVIISLLLISIAVFIIFLPCLKNGFVWDDSEYILKNASIKAPTVQNIRIIFTSFFEGNYQPITILTYLIEYGYFRTNPFGYHLTNIILHIFNCLLVFWLIYLISGKIPVSFMVALLFGIHPLHVESVAWISERKDVLYAFFFTGALISYLYHVRNSGKYKYYLLSLLFFMLSLLSKPMAITLPVILFLADYLAGRGGKAAVVDKIPFFILSIISGVVAVAAQQLSGAVRQGMPIALHDKILESGYCVSFYLNKLFFPVKLACVYPYPHKAEIVSSLLICSALLLCVAVFLYRQNGSRKKVIFGSLFFLLTLLPVLQYIPIGETNVADRYSYLPSVGVFYILSEGAVWLFNRFKQHFLFRGVMMTILAVMIGVLSLLTWNRCAVWKDNLSLWNNVLIHYPDVVLAHCDRGMVYFERGDYGRAASDFQDALKTGFRDVRRNVYLHLNMGFLYRALGRDQDAMAEFERAVAIDPSHPAPYFNIAHLYDTTGKKDEALVFYNKSLACESRNAMAYEKIGQIYGDRGNKKLAQTMYERAIDADPAYIPAYIKLAPLYGSSGGKERLASLYKKAVAYNLDLFDAYLYIGNLYKDQSKDKEAIPLYKRALAVNPNSLEALVNLSNSYSVLGKNSEAILWAKRALALNPDLAVAHNNIAVIYYYKGDYSLARKHYDRAIELGYPVQPKLLELLRQHTK